MKFICHLCKKEYIESPSKRKYGKNHFCNRSCYSKFRLKVALVLSVCQFCKKTLRLNKRKFKRDNNFCSRKHWYLWKISNRKNRFFSRLVKSKHCWNWIGTLDKAGYAIFQVRDKKNGAIGKAARFSYTLHHGKIPKGLHILHSCDNPKCVNPKHLRAGTEQDNANDRVLRGRSLVGEMVSSCKLSEEKVSMIRSIYASNKVTQEAISNRFKVTQSTISNIILRDTWKHII